MKKKGKENKKKKKKKKKKKRRNGGWDSLTLKGGGEKRHLEMSSKGTRGRKVAPATERGIHILCYRKQQGHR